MGSPAPPRSWLGGRLVQLVREHRVGGNVVKDESGVSDSPFLTARTFEQLYVLHSGKVFGYAARRVGPDLAEEITAQVFAEAWASRERFDVDRGTPVVWLLGIATNLLRRYRRTEMVQLRAFARTGVDSPARTSDEAVVVERMTATVGWAAVAQALADMPDVDREILTLAGWAGLSYDDIAAVLDLSLGTVKSRLSRARGRLEHRVGTALADGQDL